MEALVMEDLTTLLMMTVGVVVTLTLLAAPVAIYNRVTRKHAPSWDHTEREYVPTGGAYRGTVVSFLRSPGMPDGLRGPCMWSLYMLVPAVVSLPAMGLGMLVEMDHPVGVGPAWILGPSGLALALAIFVVGLRMPRRRASLAAETRGVAVWEILHNVGVILAVVLSSGPFAAKPWEAFGLEGLGMVAVPYAIVSFVHAAYLLHAARLMKEAPATVEAEDQVVYPATA
jgi:hypothetical protein